jgi:hypothetical protein
MKAIKVISIFILLFSFTLTPVEIHEIKFGDWSKGIGSGFKHIKINWVYTELSKAFSLYLICTIPLFIISLSPPSLFWVYFKLCLLLFIPLKHLIYLKPLKFKSNYVVL